MILWGKIIFSNIYKGHLPFNYPNILLTLVCNSLSQERFASAEKEHWSAKKYLSLVIASRNKA